MSESQENTVVSLDEFRKRHPVPSGKLIRDPYCKSRLNQSDRSGPTNTQKSRNQKIQAALDKHGSFSGNALRNQHKDKAKSGEGDDI